MSKTTSEVLRDIVEISNERIYDLRESIRFVEGIKDAANEVLLSIDVDGEDRLDFLNSSQEITSKAYKFLRAVTKYYPNPKYALILEWIMDTGATPKRLSELEPLMHTFDVLRLEHLKSLEQSKKEDMT